MTFSDEVDYILARAHHRLNYLGKHVGHQLHWIRCDEEHLVNSLRWPVDLKASARAGLVDWIASR